MPRPNVIASIEDIVFFGRLARQQRKPGTIARSCVADSAGDPELLLDEPTDNEQTAGSAEDRPDLEMLDGPDQEHLKGVRTMKS